METRSRVRSGGDRGARTRLFLAKFVGRIATLACTLVAIGGTASSASLASRATGHRDQVLSNETTFTRWA